MDSKFDSIFDGLSLGYLEYKHKHDTQRIEFDQHTGYALDDLTDSVQAFCTMKNQATCDEIAKSLDKLYPGTHCKGVIYTINTTLLRYMRSLMVRLCAGLQSITSKSIVRWSMC